MLEVKIGRRTPNIAHQLGVPFQGRTTVLSCSNTFHKISPKFSCTPELKDSLFNCMLFQLNIKGFFFINE